ncbi:hypothetical protein STEG23_013605 [Scotinomys teguina]
MTLLTSMAFLSCLVRHQKPALRGSSYSQCLGSQQNVDRILARQRLLHSSKPALSVFCKATFRGLRLVTVRSLSFSVPSFKAPEGEEIAEWNADLPPCGTLKTCGLSPLNPGWKPASPIPGRSLGFTKAFDRLFSYTVLQAQSLKCS